MPPVTPGLALSRALYEEVVRPAVDERWPGLAHGAALMGRGSEVLGFDDSMSTDHDWAARLLLFVGEDDLAAGAGEAVAAGVPATFRGTPVQLEVHPVRGWFLDELALDVDQEPDVADWLTLPENVLATVVGGEVFHDDVGLVAARDRLSWYPHDLWLYLLATGWWRVHPEANLVGRTGHAGDELGSSVLASRLVSDLMRLCFLMERRYPPYPKWFGTAFARLARGPALVPVLTEVVRAGDWRTREEALARAYRALAALHDALGVTGPLELEDVRMWDRPFVVPWADFPGALQAEIRDPEVQRLARTFPLGPVDRFRELLSPPRNRNRLRRALDPLSEGAPPVSRQRSPGAAD